MGSRGRGEETAAHKSADDRQSSEGGGGKATALPKVEKYDVKREREKRKGIGTRISYTTCETRKNGVGRTPGGRRRSLKAFVVFGRPLQSEQ